MTVTMGDTEIVNLEDYDFAIPCDQPEDKNVDCSRPAEWAVTLSCCGGVIMLCDPHFQDLLECIGHMDFYDSIFCKTTGIQQPIHSAERLDKR